jgi:hypothetical protein
MAEKRVVTTDGDDVHEAVQVIFDIAHQSMDWGSGMLDNEEMTAVIEFAITMGWDPPIPSSNSEAMVRLCARYPEHYDVYGQHRPAGSGWPERTFYRVQRKGSPPPGGWTRVGPP